MAKFYFYYSAMNAGKSTVLLQSSYNYRERGMNPLIMCAAIDNREGEGKVSSRLGLAATAQTFSGMENLFHRIAAAHSDAPIHCVLIDEAQFLSRMQVRQLAHVCDQLNIPVLAYGLRTDFQGNLFEGSGELLGWADELCEIKTICHCGRKATMNLRIDSRGQAVKDGQQIQIGGNERYASVCRRHFHEGLSKRRDDELPLLDEEWDGDPIR